MHTVGLATPAAKGRQLVSCVGGEANLGQGAVHGKKIDQETGEQSAPSHSDAETRLWGSWCGHHSYLRDLRMEQAGRIRSFDKPQFTFPKANQHPLMPARASTPFVVVAGTRQRSPKSATT